MIEINKYSLGQKNKTKNREIKISKQIGETNSIKLIQGI